MEIADDPPEQRAGDVETGSLQSRHMKAEVEYSIYLPPGYADSQDVYPVVFVHDGLVAMESGNQVAVVDELIRSKTIRPAIVVFIHKRFFPLTKAPGYAKMFARELLPAIDGEYRVSPRRTERASLGGGFGAMLALKATLPIADQIGRIGCQSPFAFEFMHPEIRSLSENSRVPIDALVQWGKYEMRNPSENWDMADQAQAIAAMLTEGRHTVVTEATNMGTDWVCWRAESSRMWKFLVGE